MIFTETRLQGVFEIEPEQIADPRGFFARAFDQHEWEAHGLNPAVAQCNIVFNTLKGTLRGMHYQARPFEEVKLVRCTSGAVYDVLLDLRPQSPTYTEWAAVELSAENRRMVYIPEGVAHGFQTLTDGAEVFFQMAQFYQPGAGLGVRWNDPAFAISWPLPVTVIADRDAAYPDFTPYVTG